MTERDDGIDPATADRIAKNIDLAFRFLGEAVDDPTHLAKIPDGATVVPLPADDAEHAAAGVALADRLVQEGRTVYAVPVGLPRAEAERWRATEIRAMHFRELAPRWAPDLDPAEIALAYDRDRDALLIDYAAGRRRGVAIPYAPGVFLLVELETQEVFGYVATGFLDRADPVPPGLVTALALADRRRLTTEELGGIELGDDADAGEVRRRAAAVALADELVKLGA